MCLHGSSAILCEEHRLVAFHDQPLVFVRGGGAMVPPLPAPFEKAHHCALTQPVTWPFLAPLGEWCQHVVGITPQSAEASLLCRSTRESGSSGSVTPLVELQRASLSPAHNINTAWVRKMLQYLPRMVCSLTKSAHPLPSWLTTVLLGGGKSGVTVWTSASSIKPRKILIQLQKGNNFQKHQPKKQLQLIV